MRIAFVGGTRFIGHASARRAIARGHDVLVLHRGEHPCEVARARSVCVDRSDADALVRALGAIHPDVVVDTRALTKRDAEIVAAAIRSLGAATVVLSSQDVYAQLGRLNGLPAPPPEPLVTESSPLTIPYPFREIGGHPGGPDYDKKDVEAVYRSDTGGPVAILRLPAVYGARDYRRRFGAIVDRLDAGETELPCAGGALFRWSHAHVEDVAAAIVLVAEKSTAGTFNVAERTTPSMRERAESIARTMGKSLRLVERSQEELPEDLELLGRMPNDFVVDSDAIRAALGFAEVTTEEERLTDLVASLRASR